MSDKPGPCESERSDMTGEWSPNEMTVSAALHWIRKLKLLTCQGTQVTMVRNLVAAERERCAKIADGYSQLLTGDGVPGPLFSAGAPAVAKAIAQQIRGGGER